MRVSGHMEMRMFLDLIGMHQRYALQSPTRDAFQVVSWLHVAYGDDEWIIHLVQKLAECGLYFHSSKRVNDKVLFGGWFCHTFGFEPRKAEETVSSGQKPKSASTAHSCISESEAATDVTMDQAHENKHLKHFKEANDLAGKLKVGYRSRQAEALEKALAGEDYCLLLNHIEAARFAVSPP